MSCPAIYSGFCALCRAQLHTVNHIKGQSTRCGWAAVGTEAQATEDGRPHWEPWYHQYHQRMAGELVSFTLFTPMLDRLCLVTGPSGTCAFIVSLPALVFLVGGRDGTLLSRICGMQGADTLERREGGGEAKGRWQAQGSQQKGPHAVWPSWHWQDLFCNDCGKVRPKRLSHLFALRLDLHQLAPVKHCLLPSRLIV